MTRGIQTAYRPHEGSVPPLARLVAVLLCPKSLDALSLCSDEDENQLVIDLSSDSNLSSSPQLPSVELTDTAKQSEHHTNLMTDPQCSASTSYATETTEVPPPFDLWGKRSCDHEVGPLRKRFVLNRSGTSPSTSSIAQTLDPMLETSSDVSVPNMSTKSEEVVAAVLAQYNAITRECHPVRAHSRRNATVARMEREYPQLTTWFYWVSLFKPCLNSEFRQDGIAALAQLRHMVSRRGFLRFATELASLSQTYRTHREYLDIVQRFLESHELLGEETPLKILKRVEWAPLRRLVVAGKCPAWLVHKALEDQIHTTRVLRPFLSFLAAAAEVYEALPSQVLRDLDVEVGPEKYTVQRQVSSADAISAQEDRESTDPVVSSLLKLRSLYFDELVLSPDRKYALITFLSKLGAMRYFKKWSPAETFVLDLANALGMHLGVAGDVAERHNTAAYWSVLPQLVQLLPLESLPASSLGEECKDLLSFVDERLASNLQKRISKRDFNVFWRLAEALYGLLTSPETLRAAFEPKRTFLDGTPAAENPLLEEDSCLHSWTPYLPQGAPLVRLDAATLPKVWWDWAAMRDTVLPEGTSHRDIEAIVDVQLRPCLDTSSKFMNFVSGLAAVMWPRDWFSDAAVSSYDKLLVYFHDPAHIKHKCVTQPEQLNIFSLIGFDKGKASNLKEQMRGRNCNPVALRAALGNTALYNLLVRAANLFPHVREDLIFNRAVVTSCPTPAFPQTGEVIVDPILNAFRAHAAHFLDPAMKSLEFFKMLRVLLSLRSFKQLNVAEQIVMDLAAAVCVTLPGEPSHSPFWISGETFHSIMARRPSWQQLFASPAMLEASRQKSLLFELSCLNVTALFKGICMNHSSNWTENVEYFNKLLSFARRVVEASNEDWLFR